MKDNFQNKTILAFLIQSGTLAVFIPSALKYICSVRVDAVSKGRAQKGSARVRSENQRSPPVFMDSTGALHMPRIPKNMEVKKQAWKAIGRTVLRG